MAYVRLQSSDELEVGELEPGKGMGWRGAPPDQDKECHRNTERPAGRLGSSVLSRWTSASKIWAVGRCRYPCQGRSLAMTAAKWPAGGKGPVIVIESNYFFQPYSGSQRIQSDWFPWNDNQSVTLCNKGSLFGCIIWKFWQHFQNTSTDFHGEKMTENLRQWRVSCNRAVLYDVLHVNCMP